MWIDSLTMPQSIKQINCGFIFYDGSFYGTDEYIQGNWTHEKILQHYKIKEEPGVIRFCLSFIMFETMQHLQYIEEFKNYNIKEISKQQSNVLRKWMSYQKGKIQCPTCFSQEYQFRYLESLDDNILSNIIMIK